MGQFTPAKWSSLGGHGWGSLGGRRGMDVGITGQLFLGQTTQGTHLLDFFTKEAFCGFHRAMVGKFVL